jgi:hypothetical protein
MNAELLLHWMSRLGTGSWHRFLEALDELAPDEDQESLRRRIPAWLSELAYVDFSRTTNKWKVRSPVLAGLVGHDDTALLCGARSESLVSRLECVARDFGMELVIESVPNLPSRILLKGGNDCLARVENATGVRFAAKYALQLLANVPPIASKLEAAKPEKGIVNWQVNTFDFSVYRWVPFAEKLDRPDHLPKLAAVELTSKYETKYCVTDGKSIPRRLPKREAIYAAASLQNHRLIQYNPTDQVLSTPAATQMPEVYSRIASLCAGTTARFHEGHVVYHKVPSVVAATLAVLAGQPHPGFTVQ